jgi:hypothetical protein
MRDKAPPPARWRTTPAARSSVLALAILSLPAAACDSCHSSKPYTPYTLGDAPSAAPSAAPVDAGLPVLAPVDAGPLLDASAAAAFTPIKGAAPPGDGRSFPLDGRTVDAPAGRTFATGVAADLDGDGKQDLLAWARAADGLRGELLVSLASSPAETRVVTALPEGLVGPGCTSTASLTQVGARTILLDFEPRCAMRAKAVRWLAVVRVPSPGALPAIGLELRLASPFEGETIQITGDARDRDGDGRDDITLKLALGGAPRPLPFKDAGAAATLAFFDRPAGLSRDPGEPEASLKAIAASLVADGRRKTSAPRVAGAAFALRRLHQILCEESGRSLVSTNAWPIRCGDNRVLEDAAIAEVEAALNLGDAVLALAALARLDAFGPRRKDVEALVARSVPSLAARSLHTTRAAPAVLPSPAHGPLAFDAGGDLLVHTVDSVIRVDHASFTEARVDAAIVWPTRLAASGDAPSWTLTGVEQRCDEAVLLAHFDTHKSGEPGKHDLPLPITVPVRCSPVARLSVDLLGASAQGMLAAVAGEVIALPAVDPPRPVLAESFAPAPGVPVPLGVARSPDGATVAIPTARGVLVLNAKGTGRAVTAKLWTGLDGDGAQLCVPSDGGARLACVIKGAAAIYEAK